LIGRAGSKLIREGRSKGGRKGREKREKRRGKEEINKKNKKRKYLSLYRGKQDTGEQAIKI
jgi:hypothetical protein